MAKVRFYIDEDAMRHAFVAALRNGGIDVVTVAETNRLGYSDAEQLAWATTQGRVLYSFNVKDFCRLHTQMLAEGNHHAGIIVVPRQNYSIGEQVRGLLNITETLSDVEMCDRLVYLSQYIKD